MTAQELLKKEKRELEAGKGEKTYSCKFYQPDVDIFETKEEIILFADIPGVKKEDVNITLNNNNLRLTAEIRPKDYEGLKPLYTEYNLGHYFREFQLGEKIDRDSIDARVENGVLGLRLKKVQEAMPKQIEVK